jgi:hypothetical protein
MAEERSGYKHDASDKKLDKSAEAASNAENEHAKHASGAGHDPDVEGRQQHDEAEKNSEKTRLARDVEHHDHAVDENVADAGSGARRKS